MIDYEISDEKQKQIFEKEFQLTGKYDKETSARLRKFYEKIGVGIPTLRGRKSDSIKMEMELEVERKFIEYLMNKILEGTNIPKLQVERPVGAILAIFIESIMQAYYISDPKLSGKYVLISQEFPLLKNNGTKQSTNIDYLLYNKERNLLMFLELKTDRSSFSKEQHNIYMELILNIKNDTTKESAHKLRKDLDIIEPASNKKDKYKKWIKSIDEPKDGIEVDWKNISNAVLVYLAPETLFEENKELDRNEHIYFMKLPYSIKHDFADFWPIIHKKLIELDKN